jgi:hypothetical protein
VVARRALYRRILVLRLRQCFARRGFKELVLQGCAYAGAGGKVHDKKKLQVAFSISSFNHAAIVVFCVSHHVRHFVQVNIAFFLFF